MKSSIFIISLILTSSVYAQKVKVLKFNKGFEKYRDSKHFDYVHDDFDSTKLTWVANCRVTFDTIVPGMIGESFKKLKEKSNKFGSNGFKVIGSDLDSFGPNKYIDIAVYWIRMEDRSENLALHRSNTVYLFGFLGYHKEIEGYEVSIQDDSFIIHALTYKVFTYPIGTDVNVQLGSKMRGKQTGFIMEERMYPKFFYFNMLKGSFKNAWIDEYALSYGTFLTQILKKE